MKKTLFLVFLILLILPSCNNQDEILNIEDDVLNSELQRSQDNVIIYGQNDPNVDIDAVQNAVDNYDLVILSGDFDFGFGGVDITRPNIILQGPATIINGAKFDVITDLGGITYPLSIRASGVEVHDLLITGDHLGVLIYVEEDGDPVVFEGNSVESSGAGLLASATNGGIKVLNNSLKGNFGYYARKTTGTTRIINNDIEAILDGVNVFSFNHRLDIRKNNMFSISYTGIWIGAWTVTDNTDPEWGDNDLVRIEDNDIALIDLAAGIFVGGSNFGINNVMVKGNTLTGVAGYGGLVKGPYGHRNVFIGNDLTGLTTISPQLWIMGGKQNRFVNNKLGPVEPFIFGDWGWGPAIKDAATLISTINWHKNDYLNTPDPINYNNIFHSNDYTATGLTGWSEDTESFGAVLLLNFIQTTDAENIPIAEPFVMENYIFERKFPAGTDLCTQILDLPFVYGDEQILGNSLIVGWSACKAQRDRQFYQKINERYINKGSWLQNMEMKRKNNMSIFDK